LATVSLITFVVGGRVALDGDHTAILLNFLNNSNMRDAVNAIGRKVKEG
jgi:hypothetical protein